MTSFSRLSGSAALLGCLILLAAVGCQVSARGAQGKFRLRLDDRDLEDRQDATFFGVRAEHVPTDPNQIVGGGGEVNFLVTEEDYLGDAEPFGWEGFFFVGIHPDLGNFLELPIRAGPTMRYFEVDDPAGELRWFTLGVKGSISPEIVLIRSNKITEEFSIFGDLNGFVGRASAESEPFDDDDDDTASAATYGYGYEGGVKYRYEMFELRGSWFHRTAITEEADRDYRPDITGLDNEFEGVSISLTIHF